MCACVRSCAMCVRACVHACVCVGGGRCLRIRLVGKHWFPMNIEIVTNTQRSNEWPVAKSFINLPFKVDA